MPVPNVKTVTVHRRSVEPHGEVRQRVPETLRGHFQARREAIQDRRIGKDPAQNPAAEELVVELGPIESDAIPDDPNRERDPDVNYPTEGSRPQRRAHPRAGLNTLKFGGGGVAKTHCATFLSSCGLVLSERLLALHSATWLRYWAHHSQGDEYSMFGNSGLARRALTAEADCLKSAR